MTFEEPEEYISNPTIRPVKTIYIVAWCGNHSLPGREPRYEWHYDYCTVADKMRKLLDFQEAEFDATDQCTIDLVLRSAAVPQEWNDDVVEAFVRDSITWCLNT